MTLETDFESLLKTMRSRAGDRRWVTAIAGPPGAGKSTLAEALVARLNAEHAGSAAVLPMDGYHYDDLVLEPRGLRPRKGAPDTFDVSGFAHMLARLRANEEDEIAVPVFDRSIEIARAGARMIGRNVRHLVVEGNYILLDLPPWKQLHRHFDTTVMIHVEERELRRRLLARWKDLSGEALRFKMEENDLPNGRLVTDRSIAPDFVLSEASAPSTSI